MRRDHHIPLASWLFIAILTVGVAPARADGCPDLNSHPVPGDATTVGSNTRIPCDCNDGFVPYGGRCTARADVDTTCGSRGGLVYYNGRCRAPREAEDLLMNKIRNAAEGANRTLQTWVCEQAGALGTVIQSHVKTASGAFFLMYASKSPDAVIAEGVSAAIDVIELDAKSLSCATNENARIACRNFKVFLKTVRDGRRDLAYIRRLPHPIGPAEPTIGPPVTRDASIWADASDPNLDAFCHHPFHVQP